LIFPRKQSENLLGILLFSYDNLLLKFDWKFLEIHLNFMREFLGKFIGDSWKIFQCLLDFIQMLMKNILEKDEPGKSSNLNFHKKINLK
jgi:hypothetical protein